MSLMRVNSQQSFKPIPEDAMCHPHHHHSRPPLHSACRDPQTAVTAATEASETHRRQMQSTASTQSQASEAQFQQVQFPATNKASETQLQQLEFPTTTANDASEAQIQELHKLLTDLQGGGGGGSGLGGGGSRPSSRCSVRSSSRQGSRFGSRRSTWAPSDTEEDVSDVSSSQKAHLLVASQQRLVYTLQGLRHELSSLDEEVNRIRNDVLNSRRYFNALRGVHEQVTWGSSWRRNYCSGSSSPSMDNSSCYSDETDSLARSESSCSFASWRSEAELSSDFREAEDITTSDKSSSKSSSSTNNGSDSGSYNDNASVSSGSSQSGNTASADSTAFGPVIRGRYRPLPASQSLRR